MRRRNRWHRVFHVLMAKWEGKETERKGQVLVRTKDALRP